MILEGEFCVRIELKINNRDVVNHFICDRAERGQLSRKHIGMVTIGTRDR